jgi:hypothetical protein
MPLERQAWWNTSVMPARRGLRQEEMDFQVSLGYNRDPVSETIKNKKCHFEKELKGR